jgi:hypothetical protein
MISDKDDQASSCSGQLLGGRDHMRVGCKRTKPCFGAGTRNTSGKSMSATHNWAAGQMFFLSCCPWPLIGFQRRLVEIGKIAHLHLQPPPPSPICFSRQATHNLRVVQKERKCERLQVACGSVAGKRRVSVALADEIWAGLQQTPELVAATAGSATDAPCGYACRGVCGRLMDCPRLPWALTGIEWLVRRCL